MADENIYRVTAAAFSVREAPAITQTFNAIPQLLFRGQLEGAGLILKTGLIGELMVS